MKGLKSVAGSEHQVVTEADISQGLLAQQEENWCKRFITVDPAGCLKAPMPLRPGEGWCFLSATDLPETLIEFRILWGELKA